MKTIHIECPSCQGTGLYVGMGEHDGAAVVCHTCKGKGHTTYSYEEFTGRKHRKGVKRVYRSGYGYSISAKDIVLDNGKTIHFSNAGCDYFEWLNGAEPEHIKELYCPYIADNKGMGNEPLERCRKGCVGFGSISDCKFYKEKEQCWSELEKLNTMK